MKCMFNLLNSLLNKLKLNSYQVCIDCAMKVISSYSPTKDELFPANWTLLPNVHAWDLVTLQKRVSLCLRGSHTFQASPRRFSNILKYKE